MVTKWEMHPSDINQDKLNQAALRGKSFLRWVEGPIKPVSGYRGIWRIGENRAVLADVYSAYVAPVRTCDSGSLIFRSSEVISASGAETQDSRSGYGKSEHDGGPHTRQCALAALGATSLRTMGRAPRGLSENQ